MGNLEKIVENKGYLGASKSPEFPVGQRNIDKISEKSLTKELKEDSFGKASMIELLMDKLVSHLSLPENYEIIDEAVGGEGASQELANELWKYGEKLGNKNIVPNNNARDVIKNLSVSLLSFVERAKKKGVDNYKEIIAEDFNNLREYLALLRDYNNFAKAELSGKLGFLKGKTDSDEELKMLKVNKSAYIIKCKEALGGEIK